MPIELKNELKNKKCQLTPIKIMHDPDDILIMHRLAEAEASFQ